MFDQNQIPTMDTIAGLFGIAPLALIVLAVLTSAFTNWIKTLYPVEGLKTLAIPFVFSLAIAMLLPDIALLDKIRVGIMSAVVAVLGWEFVKSVAQKFVDTKCTEEGKK